MSVDRVIIDTSVWIDYFRGGNHPLSQMVDEIINGGEVCAPGIVLAELIQGARSEREISIIEDMIETFTFLDMGPGNGGWVEAGKLSHAMKKAGAAVHLADCLIAVLARKNGCRIITRDRHFQALKSLVKVESTTI
jgi:predicted nucleic acid-binding protein